MGTYYGLHCLTCEDEIHNQSPENKYTATHSGAGLLRGDYILETLKGMGPHIKAIQDMDTYGYVELNLLAWDDHDIFEFLVKHIGHKLVCYDEYGRDEPYTGEP